jgi:hypothetical protein
MFPAALITSDCFLAYALARIETCSEVATALLDKLAYVEVAAYSTFLEWADAESNMTYREYRQRTEGINDALRAIETAMPALHRHPSIRDALPAANDLSVSLRAHCCAVRDLVPALLGLGLPDATAVLATPYDKLERQLERVMILQHRVLIVVPILRQQFLRSPEYLERWNEPADKCSLREVIFLVSAFENRLLRFRVNHYLVRDDPDYPDSPAA